MVSVDGTLQIQSFNVILINSEIVDASPLVSVTAAEDNHVNRSVLTDFTGTLFPGLLGQRRAVPLSKSSQRDAVATIFVGLFLNEGSAVDENIVQRIFDVRVALIEGTQRMRARA